MKTPDLTSAPRNLSVRQVRASRFAPKSIAAAVLKLSWTGRIALTVVTIFTIVVVFGTSFSPYDPTTIDAAKALQGPSAQHWLGTDNFGRDVLSRVMAGGRTTILLSLACTICSMVIGTILGTIAGYAGGTVDNILMRCMDVIQSIPTLLIGLLILALYGSNTVILIAAITVMFTPSVSRVARSATMRVMATSFIDAARVRGESAPAIMFLEVLPNAAPTLLVEAGLRVTHSVLTLAGLGFLGLGVQPPTPDWGLMINEGRVYLQNAPWLVLAPSLVLAVYVLALNVLLDEREDS